MTNDFHDERNPLDLPPGERMEAGFKRFIFCGLMDYPDVSYETQEEVDKLETEWDEEYKLYRCTKCGYKVNSDALGKFRHVIQFHGYNLEGKQEWE